MATVCTTCFNLKTSHSVSTLEWNLQHFNWNSPVRTVTRLRIHNQETGIHFATGADIFLFFVTSSLIPHTGGADSPFPGTKRLDEKMNSLLLLMLRLQLHVIILYSCTRLHRNFSKPARCSGHDVTHLRNIPTWSSQHSANLSQLVLTCSVFARLNSRRHWNEEPKWRRAAKK